MATRLPENAPPKDYCNQLAAQLGLDPAGHAGDFDDAVLIETPLPWRARIYDSAGALPQELIDLMAGWLAEYHAGQPYRHRPLLIARDILARDDRRTVIFYTRPSQPFAAFAKTEYRVPDEVCGPLIWAWYRARDRLPMFDRYRRAAADAARDLLVCTHGSVDVACGKFGFPLYRTLRESFHDANTLRVWRASHFGGHVFAPTFIDMPTGHYWAYVGEEQAAQIVTRRGDVTALNGHYRGWAGLPAGLMQAAERAMWQHAGWEWFAAAKQGTVIEQDADPTDPQWAVVQVDYTTPSGESGTFVARAEISHHIETVVSTGAARRYGYAQYAVANLTHHRTVISNAYRTPGS